MKKTGRPAGGALGLCLLALCLAATAASAQTAPAFDIFTAYAIPVDAEAETADKAREVAIATGQRDGLISIMQRLTLPEDWGRLPEVTGAQAAAMVESIQVDDEKSSAVRYLANLTVEFNGDQVRALLRGAFVPYTESRAQPTLVLPVYRAEAATLLFEEDNPWFAAWTAYRAPPGALFPLVIPIGDLEDVAAIDAELTLAGDEPALSRIAGRYGATNVLVAEAAMSAGALRLDLRWYGPLRQADESVTVGGEDAITRAVEETAERLETRWKQQTLQQVGGPDNSLDARLPIVGLQDWIQARHALSRNGMVQRFEVASMTQASVQLTLHFQGEPEQLALSLAQNNLELVNDGQGWMLTLRR